MSEVETTILPKRPTSLEELGRVVREAGEAGRRVRVVGSGAMPLTRLDGDGAEGAGNVQTVSMARMNKVVEHAVGDMTVAVQAGISLEALQRALAWHNQWLPVDPPVIARGGGVGGGERQDSGRSGD